jgi:hypothetical protein
MNVYIKSVLYVEAFLKGGKDRTCEHIKTGLVPGTFTTKAMVEGFLGFLCRHKCGDTVLRTVESKYSDLATNRISSTVNCGYHRMQNSGPASAGK